MKCFLYLFIILIFMSHDIKAHQCILSGTTAKEITIYNTCLANSKKENYNSSLNESILKVKLEKLKKENMDLKKKLLKLKIKFDNFKFILDSYVSEIN